MRISILSKRVMALLFVAIYAVALPFLALLIYLGSERKFSIMMMVLWYGIIALLVYLLAVPIWVGAYGFGKFKFFIGENGVTYTSRKGEYHLDWAEVKHVALYPDQLGRFTKNCFICFVATDNLPSIRDRDEYNKNVFGLQYRKGLTDIIAKYWDKPIEMIEYVEPLAPSYMSDRQSAQTSGAADAGKDGAGSMRLPIVKKAWITLLFIVLYGAVLPLIVLVFSNSRNLSLDETLLRIAAFAVLSLGLIIPVWIVEYGFGTHRCLIARQGVSYLTRGDQYRLAWTDVKHVVLYPNRRGRYTKNCYICFVAFETPPSITGLKDFTGRAFGLQYRKGLADIIQKYWGKPIENIERLEP